MVTTENERLPITLGWTRPKEIVTMTDLLTMLERIVNATESVPEEAARLVRRGGFHVGLKA